ncbi:MAG: CGNR zinc finger domain-containing protein [Mycobacteriaceae bacterium]
MAFAHDTNVALQAAAMLVNTESDPDRLSTLDEVRSWFTELDYSGRLDGDDAELGALRALRPVLRELLTAEQDRAVELVNAMLADVRAVPQLVRHDRFGWHVHAIAADEPLPTRVVVETAMAMIDVIRAEEMSRLSTCADDGCCGVVVDLSRNRSRRFCSTACGNRNAAAAYRRRLAGPA